MDAERPEQGAIFGTTDDCLSAKNANITILLLTESPHFATKALMAKSGLPNIFEFDDYRRFLRESFRYLKSRNDSFSQSAFIRKAGFEATSRGYFSRILDGKRNLSGRSILGFAKALKLSGNEIDYFENLVKYNQAQNNDDKEIYLSRMSKSVKRKASHAYRLLEGQYRYLSRWYMVAIREMVALDNFREDLLWISHQFRRKVSKGDIRKALEDLLFLGLLARDEQGRLRQSEELVRFVDNKSNHTVANQTQKELMRQSLDLIDDNDYQRQSFSSVVFSCSEENMADLREDIRAFRKRILEKYGTSRKGQIVDTVYSLGIQLIPLTKSNKEKEKLQ